MKCLLFLCLIADFLEAANRAPSYDPTELLLNVRKKVVATVDRLPNYVCRETVQRWRVLPPADAPAASCNALANLRKTPAWNSQPRSSDQLAFDVAVSKEGEMYSLVGANRFSADNPAGLVGGLTSTGSFGIFLNDIFASEAATFTYLGDIAFQGRTLAEFGYSVSLEKGGYSIENNSGSAIVPYDGTFLVDPQTFDLVRLTVHVGQLPKQLKMCDTTTTLDYTNVRMNDSEFLLPINARLHDNDGDGSQSENNMAFSSCHEFGSESALNFGAFERNQPPQVKSASEQPSLAPAQQEQLMAIRRNVMATVNRLPKYLCTETIDRSIFRPNADVANHSCKDLAVLRNAPRWKVLESESDRLRLDVAVSREEGEMYSWVGENKFHDRSLADLVGNGVTSTGAFSALLGAIFGGDSAHFTYNGSKDRDGHTLVEFGFRVPLDKSTFNVSNKKFHGIVSYNGSFLADSLTFQLISLTVHAGELPAPLQSCDETTTLDYSSVRLNGAQFLLPQNARLRVHYDDGSESENHTVFSSCHEFLGESKVSFDAPDSSGSETSGPAASPVTLPAGLHFTLALTQAIHTDTAAAGDTFTARLTSPLAGDHHHVLVPRGAAVTGRLVRVVRFYKPESLVVEIRLESIETGVVSQPFPARLATVVRRLNDNAPGISVGQDLGSFNQMPQADGPAVGGLRFEGFAKGYVIQRGLQLEGITTALRP